MNPPRINGRGDKSVITQRLILREIVALAELICEWTVGKTLRDYKRSVSLRINVEVCYISIGEAMAQLAPVVAERIANCQKFIDFGNFLFHRYREVDNEKVWARTVEDLPTLLREARALLAECEDE